MVRVSPTSANGLTTVSEVNSAQIMTIEKARLNNFIGVLSAVEMKQIDEKLAYMLSLAH